MPVNSTSSGQFQTYHSSHIWTCRVAHARLLYGTSRWQSTVAKVALKTRVDLLYNCRRHIKDVYAVCLFDLTAAFDTVDYMTYQFISS